MIKAYWFFCVIVTIFFVRFFIQCGFDFMESRCMDVREGDSHPKVVKSIDYYKGLYSSNVRRYLPSPHSELLLGVVLGINDLNKVPQFKRAVQRSGTIHVIVVSGYNISLVMIMLLTILGNKYSVKNLILGIFVTLFYAIISGFEPPVIRAWIMGLFMVSGKFYGRNMSVTYLLFVSCLVMLIISPSQLYSLSFQLSFLATFGLVYYMDLFKIIFSNRGVFEDLLSTVSAQLFVWPLISYRFEQVSIISPVVNGLVLWTIPLATILGFVYTGLISLLLLTKIYLIHSALLVLSLVVVVPLDIFVKLNYFFGDLHYAQIEYSSSRSFILVYYVLLLFFPMVLKKYISRKTHGY